MTPRGKQPVGRPRKEKPRKVMLTLTPSMHAALKDRAVADGVDELAVWIRIQLAKILK